MLVASLLLKKRSKKKYSQTFVAKQIGVPRQQVCQWENSKQRVPTKHVPNLCTLLKIDVSDFLALYMVDYYDEIKNKIIT